MQTRHKKQKYNKKIGTKKKKINIYSKRNHQMIYD